MWKVSEDMQIQGDNSGNGGDKDKITPPRIEISYNNGKVAVSGEVPNNPVIAFGMLERARFILHQFYFQQEMAKKSIVRPGDNIKTSWLQRMLNK